MYQNIVLHIPHGSDYIPEHSVGENCVTINFYGARTARSADRSERNEQEPGFKSPHIQIFFVR